MKLRRRARGARHAADALYPKDECNARANISSLFFRRFFPGAGRSATRLPSYCDTFLSGYPDNAGASGEQDAALEAAR